MWVPPEARRMVDMSVQMLAEGRGEQWAYEGRRLQRAERGSVHAVST